jgi:nucleoside-diphosphate-sugar epimerase
MSYNRRSKILVTGGTGYIGSSLIPKLLHKGYSVRVVDTRNWDEGTSSALGGDDFEFLQGDIGDKNILDRSLDGVDTVIHLAAVVSVPRIQREEQGQSIYRTNYLLTCQLVDRCKERQVTRFIFTSTCSNYGATGYDEYATEEKPLNPTSPYAKAKVEAENYILSSANSYFHPTVLRLATVFGPSPRMSFEPLLNALVKDALEKKSLLIYGGESWRPFLHIDDAIQAILLVLDAPLELVSGEVFNVGSNSLNYRKKELAMIIKKHLPYAEIEIKPQEADPRSYRVSFDKITKVLGFKTTKTLEEGIAELIKVMERHQIASH